MNAGAENGSRLAKLWLAAIALALVSCAAAPVSDSPARAGGGGNYSKLVYPGPDGRLHYTPDELGNTIPDFSNCGYRGGGVQIPDIAVKATVSPDKDSANDTARIQAAIDQVAKLPRDAGGFRGAVLLKRGTYRIASQLKITASGIVLRGEGDGEDGTVLLGTGKTQRDLINVKGASGPRELEETRAKIVDDYVPVGARSFRVESGSNFHVGDKVIVRRVGNAAWIHFIAMDRITPRPTDPKSTKQWQPFDLQFDRVITAVNGQQITVDAPITCAIEQRWGGGNIAKSDDADRIEQVGVEHLRGDSEFDSSVSKEQNGKPYAADEDHAMYLASLENVANAWIRNCTAIHFYHGPAATRSGAKWITVQDCTSLDPVSIITGGRRYPFLMCGQLVLMQRCKSDKARHAFVFQSHVCGPNAFVDCTSTNDYATSEPHHRWSVGGLYDNVHAQMAFQDRQYMGSGHGWAGANYVAWNCEGTLVCQKPPTAQNWAIGFVGKKEPGAFSGREDGYWESLGKHVEPRSLYQKQLEDRLGKQALTNVSDAARATAPIYALQLPASAKEKPEAPAVGNQISIENKFIRVTDIGRGKVRIESARGGAMKITAAVCAEVTRYQKPAASRVTRKDEIGEAQAIEFKTKDGDATQQVWIYDDQPFVFTSVSMRNAGAEPVTVAQQTPLSCAVETTFTAADLRLFGSDGISPAGDGKTSYVFLSLVDPKSKGGLVCGWLTHERASGVVDAQASQGGRGPLRVDARSEYGRLVVDPGKSSQGETFALGFFDDCREGLEAFADATAKVNQIKLPAALCGYSTWYHAKSTPGGPTSGASDEKHMAELAQFAKDQRLSDYGLNFLQIDDQWQLARRDFTSHKPNGPYPHGMKETAEAINAAGLIAGLWLTPFGWNAQDGTLASHKDWFVHRADGSVYDVKWAGDCLDMSNPQACEFLKEVIGRITHDWGFKLLKLDGLWSGMACKILYPSPEYRDDGLGDAVFHDRTKTNVEVYRDGLKLVREAAGKDVFLLGCNIAQNMRTLGGSIGLVDAMRIGPDIKADWKNVVRCAKPASHLYFLNGRVWHNDPDCLMLREPLTIDNARAWASFIAISGQLNLVSEWLPALPAERLDIYKRTIPNHARVTPRPVDLFERELPRIWQLTWGEGDERHDVVALFNWNAAAPSTQPDAPKEIGPITIDLKTSDLGLPQGDYVGFDYWANQFVSAFSSEMEVQLPPGACRVIALRRQTDRPQLLSTSRHITQGLVDVTEVSWDAASTTLRGKSKVVAGDKYELRIDAASARFSEAHATDSDVSIAGKQDGRKLRVTISSPVTREVAWEIRFARS